jgi:hypothetical protein
VFSGDGGYASAQVFSSGFTAAIGAAAALSLLGAVASAGLPQRQRSAVPAASELAA